MSDDPARDAIDAAAEQLRTANHAIPLGPRTPQAAYERVGALAELLTKLEQTLRVTGDQLDRLTSGQGLRSDDVTPAGSHARIASQNLHFAVDRVSAALAQVNTARSRLSHIRTEET
jgi:hypothetical protein